MKDSLIMDDSTHRFFSPVLIITLTGFLLAFGLRVWHIADLQFQFDEWLGGWHINPDLRWSGSLVLFLNDFWANVRDYVASGQTIAWSGLVELMQLIAGPSLVAVRIIAALGGAVGAAVVALISWLVFHRNLTATLSAAMVAVFSVAGVIFGQFADVYASAIFASSLQLAVYFLWTRRKGTIGAWLLFSGSAFVAQLLMYTQLWLTVGIFLAALWEAFLKPPRGQSIRSLLPAAIVYGILSALHLSVMLKVIPWSESFRWYMAAYYPMFWKEAGQSAGFFQVVGYFLWRLYDLFNYHLALVFNPGIYRPLQWNWVSVPFLIILVIGVCCWVSSRRKFSRLLQGSKQLAVSGPDKKQSGSPLRSDKQSKLFTAHRSLLTFSSDGIPRLLITTLVVCLIANSFFLVPFGGIRQMFFLLPLMALFYGWLVYTILSCLAVSRDLAASGFRLRLLRRPRQLKLSGAPRNDYDKDQNDNYRTASGRCGCLLIFLSLLLVLLPILPFWLSYPAIYKDRISLLDLDLISQALDQYHPQALVASEQNIHILEMALACDPRFTEVRWPGYEYPSDALDADFVTEIPVLKFRYRGKDWTVHWVRKNYFPAEAGTLLWVDLHISRDSRFEGKQMRRFYPAPDKVVPGGYRITPLKEIPGNAPAALHQSIYWPPNSFYLYLIEKQQSG